MFAHNYITKAGLGKLASSGPVELLGWGCGKWSNESTMKEQLRGWPPLFRGTLSKNAVTAPWKEVGWWRALNYLVAPRYSQEPMAPSTANFRSTETLRMKHRKTTHRNTETRNTETWNRNMKHRNFIHTNFKHKNRKHRNTKDKTQNTETQNLKHKTQYYLSTV